MEKSFIKFRDTQVYQSIHPNPEVLDCIEAFESILLRKKLIDESIETMFISSYHITYRKNDEDVILLRPFKSDWNIKVYGPIINIQQLSHLPVTFEFEMERPGWRIQGLMDSNLEDIRKAFESAFQFLPLKRLIFYPLSILQSYALKNQYLFQPVDETILNEVVQAYWSGDIPKINRLSQDTKKAPQDHTLLDFNTQWSDKVDSHFNLKEKQLHDRMKLNKEDFLSLFLELHDFMGTEFTAYRNSLSDIWFDSLLLKNEESFHAAVKDIRQTILLVEEFLAGLKQLHHEITNNNEGQNRSTFTGHTFAEPAKDAVDKATSSNIGAIESKSNNEQFFSNKEGNWFDVILKSNGAISGIPFRTKKELFGEDSVIALSVHSDRVARLAKHIAKENRMVPEYILMIKILIQRSNSQGYVTKEELKSIFMEEFKNEKVLIDFAQRFGIKKHQVHQALSTKFHVIFEHLRKQGLIKEYFRNNTLQIYWNYSVFVHQ